MKNVVKMCASSEMFQVSLTQFQVCLQFFT